MILNNQKEAIVYSEGDVSESIGMSLDLDSAQILMQMLSKNLYSDSIGSTIRECASNALDSHRRANVNMPIIVSLLINGQGDYEFSVQDFGLGLDDQDVKNIISKYGKSTKRLSANELGMFGLGFKSPLAYSSSFYFTCCKDGVERKYMMYEGESLNTIDLLYESESSKSNGVTITVPVKYSDRYAFYSKMLEQLAYFENVHFEFSNEFSSGFNRDFKIYRSEFYQHSQLSKNYNLHISLDNVYYPIDFEKLGIARINLPIALKFSLSEGLYPTPNRESLRYTPESIEIIKNKITKLADYLVSELNDASSKYENYLDVRKFYKENCKDLKISDSLIINIQPLVNYSNININNPVLKGYKHLLFEHLVYNEEYFIEYRKTIWLERNKFSYVKNRSWKETVNLNSLFNNKHEYLVHTGSISEKTKIYLKSKYKDKLNIIKDCPSEITLFSRSSFKSSYYKLLNLNKIERKHWREAIIEFQTLIKSIKDSFNKLEDLQIPKDFTFYKKPSSKFSTLSKVKTKEDISVKVATQLQKSVGNNNCKFVSDIISIEKLYSYKGFIVFDLHDEQTRLDKMYEYSKNKNITIVSVSSKEYKKLTDLNLKNVISYTEFMKGNNRKFRKIISGRLVKELIQEYSQIFRRLDLIKEVSKSLYLELEVIKNYAEKNEVRNIDSEIFKTMHEFAKDNNLFDVRIHSEYIKVRNLLEKLQIVESYFKSVNNTSYYSSSINENYKLVLVQLLKYNKVRVNLEYYKKSN